MFGYVAAAAIAAHCLADFYFQSDYLAKRKSSNGKALALHCLIYAAVVGLCSAALLSGAGAVGIVVVMALTHAAIDCGKCFLGRHTSIGPLRLFCVDQAAHLVVIVATSAFFSGLVGLSALASGAIVALGNQVSARLTELAFALLVVGKPSEVLVSLVLGAADSSQADVADEESGISGSVLCAGRWIGILERAIVVVMTLWGEFGAIAFVLTAKSIARFDMLKNQQFAERYLIGTLASVAIAILAALCARGLLGAAL